MKIVIIGAGNVATHIGKALQKAGHLILQIFSSTEHSASILASSLNTGFTTEITQINQSADLYIYAVKDSVLEELTARIQIPAAIHAHTSGSVSVNIFKGKTPRYGVLYPLQTFSKSRDINFSEVPVFIESSDSVTTRILTGVAQSISPNVHTINSDQRLRLHISAVFACNFTNLMYVFSEKLIAESGLDFDILKPLVKETAEKVMHITPNAAQTGPAVRYDRNVIDKHLKMLENDPELSEIYKKLSQAIYRNFSSTQKV